MSKLATEDTVEKAACPHDELFFGSGGYYVFCKKCSIAWVAIKGPSCDFEIDMAAGTRARPEMCMGTFKWQSSDPRAEINAMSDVREALLNDIAVMMSEFVDNWPQPKRLETALALIAKTLREALGHGK